jgi:hypothetical protein
LVLSSANKLQNFNANCKAVPHESGRIFFLAAWQDFGSESVFFFKILPGKKILPVRSTKSRQKKIPAGLPGKTVLPDC